MKRAIGKFIWNLSETGIIPPLGIFAPIVFGWMVGCNGKRIDNE
jgi:hypothetical protein